ncbi:chalcone isomerase family protein, partial [bacterium]|nr:chalcone isomerase family protein [bacterium]
RADPDFYASLLEKPFDKTLRLVLVRDVAAKDMRAAFTEQLQPRLAASSPEDAAAAIERLGACFTGEKLASSTEVLISWRAGGSLVVKVGGTETTVDSPPLGRALFAIFLDAEAISPGAKAAFAERVPELLRSPD